MQWEQVRAKVQESIIECLIKEYSSLILVKFNSKIVSIVYNYTAHLPKHVLSSELDDLTNIAKIEFVETLRSWDPQLKDDIWAFAYTRILGAMKDHLRYLTKADPGRLYNWITDAAYVYLTVNNSENIQSKIENSIQLYDAMKSLSFVEKKIINERYKNDKTFKDIGTEINLSESQVTRVYKEAVAKLKKIMEEK